MKKIIQMILTFVLVAGMTDAVSAASDQRQTINIDGNPVKIVAYNISDNNYFKLRDIAIILKGTKAQFDVKWNQSAGAVEIVTGTPYQAEEELTQEVISNPSPTASKMPVYKDGKRISVAAYIIGGNNYFKLRDVAAEIDFGVFWSADTGISIDTNRGYALTPEEEKDLYIQYAKRRHGEFVEQNRGMNEDEKYYNFADVDHDGKIELLVKKGAGITAYKAVDGEVQRLFCDPLPESPGTYGYCYATYQGKDYIAYVTAVSSELTRLFILESGELSMMIESMVITGANEWMVGNKTVSEAEYNAHKAAITYPAGFSLDELK